MTKGTVSDTVIGILQKIPITKRNKVKEVTLDLAPTMERIAKRNFPKASMASDRFHVQKPACDAVQEIRVKYRWEAIDQKNKEIELASELKETYLPNVLKNGDTLKQLLAHSHYLLFNDNAKWPPSQQNSAEILFKFYPTLQTAYRISRNFSFIFIHTKDNGVLPNLQNGMTA